MSAQVGGGHVIDGTRAPSSLRDYIRILRRRKWLVLQALILVPAAAVLFSLRQEKLFESCAQVLLPKQNLATQLTGAQDQSAFQAPDRIAQTAADVARVPEVATRATRAVGSTQSAAAFLKASSVTTKQNANLLSFCVRDPDPAVASRNATSYASAYTEYQKELDTAPLDRAIASVEKRIAALHRQSARGSSSPQLTELTNSLYRLEAMKTLTTEPTVVHAADRAEQVQPRPVRNGVLGLVLGVVLGIALAFLWEALDTRVRSADEVAEHLGLPLLARLPEPPRKKLGVNRLAMLDSPAGPLGEPTRVLRTNLEFANLERQARTIMISSAVEGEGKSTTIANLAIAFARAGKHVVLVDLDLRRPILAKFFGLEDRPGVTDVALGHAELEDAVASIALTAPKEASGGNGSSNGRQRQLTGVLGVVPSGPIPPNPGEFVETKALADILDQLKKQADLVLIDAPPLLHLGDAMTLSAKVDGLLLVSRLKVVRRPMLNELARVLASLPAAKLGFALTAAHAGDDYGGYGYAASYRYHAPKAEREPVA